MKVQKMKLFRKLALVFGLFISLNTPISAMLLKEEEQKENFKKTYLQLQKNIVIS